jgi:hypothetical protein
VFNNLNVLIVKAFNSSAYSLNTSNLALKKKQDLIYLKVDFTLNIRNLKEYLFRARILISPNLLLLRNII